MNYKPTWDLSTIPDDLIIQEAGRRRAAMRQTYSGGRNGGRPPVTKRCPCGAMTKQRAKLRNHLCEVPA